MTEVNIAADAIEDVLRLVEPGIRMDVLKALVDRETKAAAERADGELRSMELCDWTPDDEGRFRAEMTFKSLVVQTFVREITNNHSNEDAARILFREHPDGNGSGWLPDYLDGLPAVSVDLKRAAQLA